MAPWRRAHRDSDIDVINTRARDLFVCLSLTTCRKTALKKRYARVLRMIISWVGEQGLASTPLNNTARTGPTMAPETGPILFFETLNGEEAGANVEVREYG